MVFFGVGYGRLHTWWSSSGILEGFSDCLASPVGFDDDTKSLVKANFGSSKRVVTRALNGGVVREFCPVEVCPSCLNFRFSGENVCLSSDTTTDSTMQWRGQLNICRILLRKEWARWGSTVFGDETTTVHP
ncbi:UNVERIFIED_CONTAM: hypothetical protein Sangu_3047900 [Sesamum angustifolium]|uniref:Uncharacterized protein n=1 Tax=Sesamum angustifolium TaxID=2727405 RepID=A0AAW2KFF1_9LAMI